MTPNWKEPSAAVAARLFQAPDCGSRSGLER